MKLEVIGQELEILPETLGTYQHLRYINLSDNKLSNVEVLWEIPHILKLELQKNSITSLEVFDRTNVLLFLQHLNLKNNRIKQLSSIQLPRLEQLLLAGNQIEKVVDFSHHENLQLLELRNNKLTSLQGIANLPALKELYAADNKISSIEGLKNLPSLTKLHLRKNKISKFTSETVPNLPALQYLNLRENDIPDAKSLASLSALKKLSYLNIAATPLTEEQADATKKEVLIYLNSLSVVNKEEVTTEDREEAANDAIERRRLEEEARLEAERAAKEAADAGEEKVEDDD
jgi:Leucine-rich repeat (LRR) protein